MKASILIVDDERDTRELMARALGGNYRVTTAADAEQAVKALEADPSIALMLSDVRMPGADGIQLLKAAKKMRPHLACILLTAFGSVDLAVEAMKDGADDFLTKPVDLDQLDLRVEKALKTRALEEEVVSLRSELDVKQGLRDITGTSDAMQKVFHLIRQAAPTQATVLIEGPSGTGKELVAHALHSLSPRANGPFVAVECAALNGNLLESELFGHEKGAFTGAVSRRIGRAEAADGGTLFLDEIGDLTMQTQVKLLRFLQERTFSRVGSNEELHSNVRFLAATSRNLEELMEKKLFREDLYYRLNIFPILMPSLSQRKSDIILLAEYFIENLNVKYNKAIRKLSPGAIHLLMNYAWPGNVRELENCMERAVLTASDDCVHSHNLPPSLQAVQSSGSSPLPDGEASTLEVMLANYEREILMDAIRKNNGNQSAAGRQLGLSPRMMNYRMNRLGLTKKP